MAKYKIVDLSLINGQLPSQNELEKKHTFIEQILTQKYVTYIYYNLSEKELYIGKAGGKEFFLQRHKQHIVGKDKEIFKKFTDVLLIYGELLYNDSAILALEHLILKYMFAEKDKTKFKLYNDNLGSAQAMYEYRNEIIEHVLYPLWQNELKERKLVKNTDLNELREAFVFKYSPFNTYDKAQLDAIESVTELNQSKSHLIYGRAGTGKSVLFIALGKIIAENNLNKDKFKIAMITSTNTVDSVKKVINLLELVNKIIVTTIASFMQHNEIYDVIIVDESHKLNRYYKTNLGHQVTKGHLTEEENEFKILLKRTKQLVLLFDEDQSIKPQNILPGEIIEFALRNDFAECNLIQQFRINCTDKKPSKKPFYTGEDYLKGILYGLGISKDKNFNPKVFENKYFGLCNSIAELFKYIEDANDIPSKPRNRVIAGYSRKWVSRSDKYKNNEDYQKLEKKEDKYKFRTFDWVEGFNSDGTEKGWYWNYSSKNWVNRTNSESEIGCIHAIQNVDLNHVGVIVGKDLIVENGNFAADEEAYFDIGGNPTDNPLNNEELTNYIKNIYYVLLTRGIDGCRVYFEDEEVKLLFMERIREGNKSSVGS